MYRLFGATTAFCLVSSLAIAGINRMRRSSNCYPNPAFQTYSTA